MQNGIDDVSCVTICPQYSVFVDEENWQCYPIDPEMETEIREEINNISTYLETVFEMPPKNIEVSVYSGKTINIPKAINGIRYELDDLKYKIIGEIFVVFMVKNYLRPMFPFYIFRTEIDKSLFGEMGPDIAKRIVELSGLLKLKMSREERGRESLWWEPIFYQKQEKFDLDSFKKFVQNINYIADAFYPLKLPKRRQYAKCSLVR